jgi:hypothetical protein
MPVDSLLSNVEFFALKMFKHPGESARFYQRALHQYRYPAVHHKMVNAQGRWNSRTERFEYASARASMGHQYFMNWRHYPNRYVGKLWENVSSDPNRGAWILTPAGTRKAQATLKKLGLEGQVTPNPRGSACKTKAAKLVDFWRARGGALLRPALKAEYDRISGLLNEDGTPISRWATKYTSIYVSRVLKQHGRQINQVVNPKTGRKVGVWMLCN